MKDQQGNEEANSAILQQMTQMASRMGVIGWYNDSQLRKVNELVNQVNKVTSHSKDNKPIPGTTDTSGSGGSSTELTTANSLIISLCANLKRAKTLTWKRNRENRRDQNSDGGRGGDGGQDGKGLERHKHKVLGAILKDVDRQLTRTDDEQTENLFKNKYYYHTYGYDCTNGHDSEYCMWIEKGHYKEFTAENPMGGYLLYKRLSHCP